MPTFHATRVLLLLFYCLLWFFFVVVLFWLVLYFSIYRLVFLVSTKEYVLMDEHS